MFGLFGNQTSSENTQLIEFIKAGALLVDVRSHEEFSGGSVKGAINIPVDKVSERVEEFQNKGNIVVFCQSGGRSGQAKSILEQRGIKNIINGGSWFNVNNVVNNN